MRFTTHDDEWVVRGEILKFLTRLELERCQLVVGSSELIDEIQRIVTELGLLRYIDYVSTASFGRGFA